MMYDLNKELDSFFRKQDDDDDEQINPFTKKINHKANAVSVSNNVQQPRKPPENVTGQHFPQPRLPPKPIPQSSIDWTALTKQEPQHAHPKSAASSIQEDVLLARKPSDQSKNLSSFSIPKPEASAMNYSNNRSISRDLLIESSQLSPRQREHSRKLEFVCQRQSARQ
jgi:hypothetical protein